VSTHLFVARRRACVDRFEFGACCVEFIGFIRTFVVPQSARQRPLGGLCRDKLRLLLGDLLRESLVF
jgi:hypothetical protein